MSDEQDKGYVEELTDMWNENGWLLDALGGKDMVQQEDNTFNYFEEVAKSMQPNTSQPAAMVANSVGNSNIQYNTELFNKVGGTIGDYLKKIFKAEAGCLVVWRAGRVVTDKLYTPDTFDGSQVEQVPEAEALALKAEWDEEEQAAAEDME